LFALIGIMVIATPFIKPLRKAQNFTSQLVVASTPALLGVVLGIFAGFWINFGACYKKDCSIVEDGAILLIPALTLLLTVPLGIKIYKLRKPKPAKNIQPHTASWVAVGLALLLVAMQFLMRLLSS
jgi:hypothetical protein